jgi:hypothetical protein
MITLLVRDGLLARVVEGPSAEDEISVKRERGDPMRVVFEDMELSALDIH